MSLKLLEDNIKNKKMGGIYLLYGTETYDIERYIEKIKKCYTNLENGMNLFVLDKTNIDTLADICESVSFFGMEKVIIIKGINLKFNTKILDNINNPELVIIFKEESVDKRTAEYKYLAKKAICVEFNKLNEKDAMLFAMRTLSSYKINVSEEVAKYLISVCSENKQILINEFRKIVAYKDTNSDLTKKDIDYICCKTLDAKIFDLMDLIVAKKKEQALGVFDDMITQKTYIGIISSMLFKQIKQIYQIKLMEEKIKKEGININVAGELGIHPFVYGKLKNVGNMYTIEKLENLMLDFDEYDEASKTGKIDSKIGLKRIILDM